MRIFRGHFDEIVRIDNREFLIWKDTIIGFAPELKDMGFKYDAKDKCYFRKFDFDEIDSAYMVYGNYAMYKGLRARVGEYKENTGEIYIMFDVEEDGEAAGITPFIDYNDKCYRYYYSYVPEKDITDIYEVRKPFKDFPFECPRIVFHKKDGVWLPWHDYGTLLKDDEWM